MWIHNWPGLGGNQGLVAVFGMGQPVGGVFYISLQRVRQVQVIRLTIIYIPWSFCTSGKAAPNMMGSLYPIRMEQIVMSSSL
jgi:hypothetical protein